MALLVFIAILLLLAVAGVLGLVIKVALGVALGIVLAVMVLSALIAWRVRRFLRGAAPTPPRTITTTASSTVEVLESPKDESA